MDKIEKQPNIIIYKTEDGKTEIEVNLEKDTVWLSLNQISTLFERDKSVISRHIKNIFSENELHYPSTVAKNATVQKEGSRFVERIIEIYNLDVVISVGYRVKSIRGTQFRIWANQIIKDYLVKGYSINKKRLQKREENLKQLENTIDLLSKSIENNKHLELNEAKGFIDILTKYTKAFVILNKFDENRLEKNNLEENILYQLDYNETVSAIQKLKSELILLKEASNLFGNEKDNSLKGILGNIAQTFDGVYLYPTIEERAAHLLYFVIKNHPFTDGNKRIGAFLFVWYLQKNKFQNNTSGEYKINENTLITLSLLMAQSDPNQKEIMIKLIINLIKN